jgi:RNA polymerase-binding transcription factor DksA
MEDNALNKDHSRTTSMPNDMAELGTGNFDQELTLRVLGSEEDTLDRIEAAIERIDDGSYGRCGECGEKTRLDAVPYAEECVRCASQQEEGHGPKALIALHLKGYPGRLAHVENVGRCLSCSHSPDRRGYSWPEHGAPPGPQTQFMWQITRGANHEHETQRIL